MSKTETPDIVEHLTETADCCAEDGNTGIAAVMKLAAIEIKRLRAELAKHQWRTMECAPRDGTYVLVWRPDEGDCHHEAHVGIDCYLDSSWYRSRRNQQPTHWQPLPSPPDRARSDLRLYG